MFETCHLVGRYSQSPTLLVLAQADVGVFDRRPTTSLSLENFTGPYPQAPRSQHNLARTATPPPMGFATHLDKREAQTHAVRKKITMPRLPSHLDRATKEFSDIRRQFYMYWEAYEEILEKLDEFDAGYQKFIREEENIKYTLGYVSYFGALFNQSLDRISLEYTAGASIEELKGLLYPAAVDAFEAWCVASDEWYFNRHPDERGEPLNTPIEIGDASSYLDLLRLLSLGVLFHEDGHLRRIAKILAVHRKNEPDTVIEELLYRFIPNAKEVDAVHHFDLYDHLISAAWSQGEKSAEHMTKFLNAWYKYFEGAHWHNAHLRFGESETSPDLSNYYGYFAWEAAAMVYLYDLDDSAYRNHVLYPKDLVDWAFKQGKAPKSYEPDSTVY